MGKKSSDKDIKTNAMRFLEKNKVPHTVNTYECEEFHDGVQIANMLGQSVEHSYKTLVMTGKSGEHYVFVLPVDREVDMKKAARAVAEKSVEMVHVKDINGLTGYIRGGVSPLGMKKQFRTVVDITADAFDWIIISGGRLGSQITLDPHDLVRVINGSFEDILI